MEGPKWSLTDHFVLQFTATKLTYTVNCYRIVQFQIKWVNRPFNVQIYNCFFRCLSSDPIAAKNATVAM